MRVFSDVAVTMNSAWNTPGGEMDRAVRSLITVGWLSSYPATREQAIAAITNWANAHGFTSSKYGTKWDDYALEALLREAASLELMRASRGRPVTKIQARSSLRGYGLDRTTMTRAGQALQLARPDDMAVLQKIAVQGGGLTGGYVSSVDPGFTTKSDIGFLANTWGTFKSMPLWQKIALGVLLASPVGFISYRMLKK